MEVLTLTLLRRLDLLPKLVHQVAHRLLELLHLAHRRIVPLAPYVPLSFGRMLLVLERDLLLLKAALLLLEGALLGVPGRGDALEVVKTRLELAELLVGLRSISRSVSESGAEAKRKRNDGSTR